MKNNGLKFYSLLNDTTFKYLFKNPKTRTFFNKVILYAINIDISDYNLIDNELNTDNNGKDYRLDILLKKDNNIISIEMNQGMSSTFDDKSYIKNHSYLYRLAGNTYLEGDEYTKYQITQMNFNDCFCPLRKDIKKLTLEFTDKTYDVTFEDIKSFEIYLESYRGLCYNEDNKKDYYFSLFTATSYEEMRKIAGSDKEALVIVDEIEKLNQDKYFGGLYDANIVQKKLENTARHEGYNEGIAEGITQGITQGIEKDKKEIAIRMIYDKMPDDIISKYTNLSLEEINKIKQENQKNS